MCGVLVGLGQLPVRGATAAERPVPVVDLHVDLPYRHLFKGKPFDTGLGEFQATKLEAAGVVGVVLPLFVPEWASAEGARTVDYERSYAQTFTRLLETPPYSLPGCGVQRAGAGSPRPVQTWLAFEGAAHLDPDPTNVAQWMMRGVRSFGVVHSSHNSLATSSGEPSDRGKGLTPRGRRLVEVIGELGGVLDVSHASDAATEEMLELARATGAVVIATHSNARALAAHPRNLSDAQLRAIAQSGGVVGINFHQPFLAPSRRATLADVVAQVRYVARVAGIDHVALGSDFEGGIRPVAELRDASRYQTLAQALLEAGFSREEVRKVLSENALRVLCRPFFSAPGGDRNRAR
jgi:membrane dipeptidase